MMQNLGLFYSRTSI